MEEVERSIEITRDGLYYLIEHPGLPSEDRKPRRLWFKGTTREEFSPDNRVTTKDSEGNTVCLYHLDPFIMNDAEGNFKTYAAPVYKIVAVGFLDKVLERVALPAYDPIWLKLGRYLPGE